MRPFGARMHTHYLWYAERGTGSLPYRSASLGRSRLVVLGDDFAGVFHRWVCAYNARQRNEARQALRSSSVHCNENRQEIQLKAPASRLPALSSSMKCEDYLKCLCAGWQAAGGKISPATALKATPRLLIDSLDRICARPLVDQKALALQRRMTDADKDNRACLPF